MNARPDRRPAGDANDADAVRRRQLLLFSVIAAVVLAAITAWLGMGGGKTAGGAANTWMAGTSPATTWWGAQRGASFGDKSLEIRPRWPGGLIFPAIPGGV